MLRLFSHEEKNSAQFMQIVTIAGVPVGVELKDTLDYEIMLHHNLGDKKVMNQLSLLWRPMHRF